MRALFQDTKAETVLRTLRTLAADVMASPFATKPPKSNAGSRWDVVVIQADRRKVCPIGLHGSFAPPRASEERMALRPMKPRGNGGAASVCVRSSPRHSPVLSSGAGSPKHRNKGAGGRSHTRESMCRGGFRPKPCPKGMTSRPRSQSVLHTQTHAPVLWGLGLWGCRRLCGG